MEKNDYYVYLHENKINGKKYIGYSGISPVKRWQKGKGYKNCILFYEAINKYGWDMFRHEILFTDLKKEEAQRLEEDMIKKYKSNDSEYGYNLFVGAKHDEISKQKLIGRTPWNKGGKMPIESKLKISKANKGKKISEDTKLKMRISKKNKKVRCIETGIIYNSTREAMRETKILQQSISKNCRGLIYSAGKMSDGSKLHWEFVD